MTKVSIIKTEAGYPTIAPYHPSENYPEYPFDNYISKDKNYVYEGVRKLFYQLGYDKDNWNTKAWNPLGFIIKPEMTVVIKPNFVQSRHKNGEDLFSIITHPSVLRAVADYCWIALRGNGKIIIADSPQYDCNFQELIEATKIDKVVDFYTNFHGSYVELVDLRNYWSPWKHFDSCLKKLPGDKNVKQYTVKVDTIDNYFQNIRSNKNIDFLKIDTEGWDYFVISGGMETILNLSPIILTEFEERNMKQAGVNPNEFIDLLENRLNYTCLKLGEDLLCIPSKQ